MRIRLLGTGSADGWPNPFCACASCDAERRDGRARRPSSALIDDRLLIDCGPTTPHLPAASGVSLRSVEHVLLTHGHPDHLHPAFLLSRSWVTASVDLHVWGPPAAIDLCRDWLGPDTDVTLHAVAPGDDVMLATAGGDYRMRVHAARHAHGNGDVLAEEAVLFEITAPDGDRLLYATDTGPLSPDDVAAIAPGLSAVVIDETFGDHVGHGTGHLDLHALPPLLDDLRERGIVTSSTIVAATHLSHHNPPTRELVGRLAPLGVIVPDDLDVIDTARTGGRPARHRLILGGARSGKSHLAESRASTAPRVTYVATGGERPKDAEWADRVAAHRARRPEHWQTIETTDVITVLAAAASDDTVLVDCLALWLTAELDGLDAWTRADDGGSAQVRDEMSARIEALVDAVRACPADVLLVSNEVGMGIVPATAGVRLYRDLLGILNVRVAEACDDTTLVVAGRPLVMEGGAHA